MLPYLHWKICKGLQIKRGRELLLYAIQSLNIFVAVSFVTRLAESSLHRLAVFTISQAVSPGIFRLQQAHGPMRAAPKHCTSKQ